MSTIHRYSNELPGFVAKQGQIVSLTNDTGKQLMQELARHVEKSFHQGLAPLFVTGSGLSVPQVPDLNSIVKQLREIYEKLREPAPAGQAEKDRLAYVNSLFNTWEMYEAEKKKDRDIVARILMTFQSDDSTLLNIWREFNKWLLDKIVDSKPGESHSNLATLCETHGAKCVTLNFDGLLVRQLRGANKVAFSLPDQEDCENFLTRVDNNSEYLEVQARGDILYLMCKRSGFCTEKRKQSLWASVPTSPPTWSTDNIIRCPSCGEPRVSDLAFPGSFAKDLEMQSILSVLWRYLTLRVSCVVAVGVSGWWDPLLVAHIGDVLRERDVPLVVVDNDPEHSYLVQELVSPSTSLAVAMNTGHTEFFAMMNTEIIKAGKTSQFECATYPIQFGYPDYFWSDPELQKELPGINCGLSAFEEKVLQAIRDEYRLDKYAQLGLKSVWLGIGAEDRKNHNRLSHSLGVLRVASYLYDRLVDNGYSAECDGEKQFLRIAALLHDVGHLPFSHLIEEIFGEFGWRPANYVEAYSHGLGTEVIVRSLFDNHADYKDNLKRLGYSVDDLVRLIQGQFGVGFMDAIINSPVDADKIDYVFRDTVATGTKLALSPAPFLRDFVSELTVTPERMLAFSGLSARAAYDLLQGRTFLYSNLYLRSGPRLLECAVKSIMQLYFAYNLAFDTEKLKSIVEPMSDLGFYKILHCSDLLRKLASEAAKSVDANSDIEMSVIKEMAADILKSRVAKKVKDGVECCLDKITKIDKADKLKDLESEIVYTRIMPDQLRTYQNAAFTCMLRQPGALLIEVAGSRSYLSVPEARRAKERSDGTATFSECILVPSGDPTTWYAKQKAQVPLLGSQVANNQRTDAQVRTLAICKDPSYADQAKNLFRRLTEKGEVGFVPERTQ